jgi:hypothetical protein
MVCTMSVRGIAFGFASTSHARVIRTLNAPPPHNARPAYLHVAEPTPRAMPEPDAQAPHPARHNQTYKWAQCLVRGRAQGLLQRHLRDYDTTYDAGVRLDCLKLSLAAGIGRLDRLESRAKGLKKKLHDRLAASGERR